MPLRQWAQVQEVLHDLVHALGRAGCLCLVLANNRKLAKTGSSDLARHGPLPPPADIDGAQSGVGNAARSDGPENDEERRESLP